MDRLGVLMYLVTSSFSFSFIGFKLAQLFRAFALYEKKSHDKKGASLGALRNLVNSYCSREDIGDQETSQVWTH